MLKTRRPRLDMLSESFIDQIVSEAFKRKLLNDLCLSAVRTLVKFLYTVTGLELMPELVAVTQTFGDRINFHPHIHVLMTEGGTAPDGVFHRVCRFHDEVIQEIFTHEVFSLLVGFSSMRQGGRFVISMISKAYRRSRWTIWNLSPGSLPIFPIRDKS